MSRRVDERSGWPCHLAASRPIRLEILDRIAKNPRPPSTIDEEQVVVRKVLPLRERARDRDKRTFRRAPDQSFTAPGPQASVRAAGRQSHSLDARRRDREHSHPVEFQQPLFTGDDPQISIGGLRDVDDMSKRHTVLLHPDGPHVVAQGHIRGLVRRLQGRCGKREHQNDRSHSRPIHASAAPRIASGEKGGHYEARRTCCRCWCRRGACNRCDRTGC